MEAALTRSAQGGDALFAGDDPFSPPAPPVAALKAKVASKLHAYAATRPAPGATTRPNVPAVLVNYMMWGATQTDPDTDAGGISESQFQLVLDAVAEKCLVPSAPPPSPPSPPSAPPPPSPPPPSLPPFALVTALGALYDATGGPNWLRSDRWKLGEPCVNSWFGVHCCPLTHPLLLSIRGERWCKADPTSTAASRRRRSRRLRSTEVCWNPSATMVPALTEETAHCCAAVKNGDVSTVDDPIGWYQPITGTEDDYGLCGVVEVSLPSNRLVGKLDDSNVAAIQAASQEATSTGGSRGRLGLTALQLLDVSTPVDPENQEEIDNANKLTGAIPTWLLELPTLQAAELAGNNFTYNATALDELSKKEANRRSAAAPSPPPRPPSRRRARRCRRRGAACRARAASPSPARSCRRRARTRASTASRRPHTPTCTW